MSFEQSKNALVASLFELSNAAKDAASATVTFYKAAGAETPETAASLAALSDTVSGATQAALANFPFSEKPAENGSAEPKKKARGKKAQEGEEATEETEQPEKTEKPRKKRAEKDPNAPKKPLTTYLRFNLNIRDQMKRERLKNGQPTFPATELNQIIADRWANLSSPEKEKLQKDYEAEYEAYKKVLEAYNKEKAEKPEGAKAEEKPQEAAASSEKTESEPKAEPKTEKKKPEPKADEKEKAPAATPRKKKSKAEANGTAPQAPAEEPKQEAKKTKKRKEKTEDDKKPKKKKTD